MEALKINPAAEHYRKHGLKIGFIPNSLGSTCFHNFRQNLRQFTMQALVEACPNGLGLMPELTKLIVGILGVPMSKLKLIPMDHRDYGTLTKGMCSGNRSYIP